MPERKEGLQLAPNSSVTLFRGRGAADAPLFEVLLETGPQGFEPVPPSLTAIAQTNAGPIEETVELPAGEGPLVDPTLVLELEWVTSAFEVVSDEAKGFLRLWTGLQGFGSPDLLIDLAGLDTFELEVESALLGVIDATGTAEGELLFGGFRSRRVDHLLY